MIVKLPEILGPTKRQRNYGASAQMGEAIVTTALAARGWTVRSLNGVSTSPNADLIAVKGARRITVQVKASPHKPNKSTDKKAIRHVFMAGGGEHKANGKPIFNSSSADITADFVVVVSYSSDRDWLAFVLPVELAENACRQYLDSLMKLPKKDGNSRKAVPQIWLIANIDRKSKPRQWEIDASKILADYQERWDILELPISQSVEKLSVK